MDSGTDPLSMLAAEEEAKVLQANKAKEAAQVTVTSGHRSNVDEEEKRLESITKIHLHHPNIGINSNIKEIEIKDRNCFRKSRWMNSFCVVNFDLEIGQIKVHQYDNERSGFPKSVVLLSDEPFVGLYKKVIEVVGPLYFQFGNTLLEVAHQNMAGWPELKLGQTYELPILGSIFTFHVPYTTGAPHIIDPILKQSLPTSAAKDESQVSVSNLQSIDLYHCFFKNFSNRLWMLWEMVLLGHPIIVMSSTPPISSDAVLALVSLISPLTYCGDYRPYFTIHDPDFHKYTATRSSSAADESSSSSLPASIIGVTNPFFLKALSHWPTTITIGACQRLANNAVKKSKMSFSRDSASKNISDNKEKIMSDYKPHTSPDKAVLKKITDNADISTNNEALRTHFLQLTLNFLIPLERYFSSLLPLAKPPRLKNFDNEEFLTRLSENDETYIIDSKSREVELYKQFLDSINFKHWLEEKRKEAIRHLNTLYRKAILDADIQSLLKNRNPSTALDLYKRVKDQLILEENLFQTPEDIKAKIRSHLNLILPYLPH
eukprot:gene7845-9206_t